jgi:hypothetical protein
MSRVLHTNPTLESKMRMGDLMALTPAKRNEFIAQTLSDFIDRVKSGEGPALDRYRAERAVLERLIPINSDGFRGVTLTAIMGKFVRSDINTSTEFSSINPRSIFEKGIRPILKQHRIPTGASAPLNVAKNIQVLDEKWAEGRKPETAALAAVDYIRRVNRHWADAAMRDDLIMMFLQRLLAYAAEVASHDVDLAPIDGIVPIILAKRLAGFALAFPEGGSMPQFVAGALIAEARSTDTDFAPIGGVEASVFGTNSTSNKPADLWETLSNGDFANLYEVTCKPVDTERLDAAVDSFAKLGLPTTAITFVCRVPEDCLTLVLADGAIIHRGVPFQFLDFAAFVETIFVMLTPVKQLATLERVALFVLDPARAVKTKSAWASAFG